MNTIEWLAFSAGILVTPVIIICLAKELARIKAISKRNENLNRSIH